MKININNIEKYSNASEDIGGMKRLSFVVNEVEQYTKDKNCPPASIKILDVGCGNGTITLPLGMYGYNIVGIDVDEDSIAAAKKRNDFPNVFLDFTDIDTINEDFDVILCTQVLEHLEYPDKLIKKMVSRLKADGIMILTIPNGYGLSEIVGRVSKVIKQIIQLLFGKSISRRSLTTCSKTPHIQFFTQKRFILLCEDAGLRLIKTANHTFILSAMPFNIISINLPKNLRRKIEEIDGKIADFLPPAFACGWYFVFRRKCI